VTPIVETQRLKLREFSPGDLDELAAMVADEDQMRFYPRPKTRDEASAWISRNLVLYTELGFGFWLIESLLTSVFVGYAGIRPLVPEDGASETEIGWHIGRRPGTKESPQRLRWRSATWHSHVLRCRAWWRSSIPSTSRLVVLPRTSGCTMRRRPSSRITPP
jgi:RimJ/RimL family protein N-acetyltransferase